MSTVQALSTKTLIKTNEYVTVTVTLPTNPNDPATFVFNPSTPVVLDGSGKVKYIITNEDVVFVGAKFYQDDDNSLQSIKIETNETQSILTLKAENKNKSKDDDIAFKVIVAARDCDANGAIYQSQDPQVICQPEI
ncbi:DP-EP family protein [Shewanella sp. SR44-3]|uniref:DP-EP family protein n=1 Tax=Shewanella sp. SR44-3 TaxID=2760936 RepID=UPI0015FD75F5|nr:DP-EP family protein [Shewanella sp. SR44-3]MBB1270518.1 DP-EP family protein [Shewanella sp. SR44-3]